MTRKFITLLAFVLLFAGAHGHGSAQERIGQVKVVSGEVRITHRGTEAPAKAGSALFEKDTITTGANSAVGITFTDNSRVSMGPDSELSLEAYAFSRPGRQNSFEARLKRGSLTATSGQIAKSRPLAMRILLPTTVLGVKGTTLAARVGGEP